MHALLAVYQSLGGAQHGLKDLPLERSGRIREPAKHGTESAQDFVSAEPSQLIRWIAERVLAGRYVSHVVVVLAFLGQVGFVSLCVR